MYVYDRANLLAADIKECAEFKEYKALKDELYQDEATKSLIKKYKSLQFEAQAAVFSGQKPSEETMEQLKKMGEVLGFNEKVGKYFAAEYKFNTLVSDLYKIIGEASELNDGLFEE